MKNVSLRASLYISIGFISMVWIVKVIRNTVFIDNVLALFESMPQVFLQSFFTAALVILCVSLLLRLSKEKYNDIGFKKDNMFKQIRNSVLFGVIIFILDTFLINPISDALSA